MKKLKLIYNPVSGDASFKNKLDYIVERLQSMGYSVGAFRICADIDLECAFFDIYEDYELICVSGGDGTLSSVINIMASRRLSIPIAIFPFGTANDFAAYLGIPKDVKLCCDIIENGNYKKVDIGKVNDKYFINVCSAGLLADVAYKTDTNLKNALGKIAYYIKGIEEIPKFSPIKMRMEFNDSFIDDNFLLFLILNGSSAGGFNKLAPEAMIDDGQMDVIAIKSQNLTNILTTFLKVLRGDHVDDPNIYHFKTDKLRIKCEEAFDTDIDGEKGPSFPLEIEVLKHFLTVLAP